MDEPDRETTDDTLKPRGDQRPPVKVTVSVAGGDDHEVAVDGNDVTYGDLLAEVGLSPQEAAVLVDGRPVPEDAAVEVDRVEVLRLIQGG